MRRSLAAAAGLTLCAIAIAIAIAIAPAPASATAPAPRTLSGISVPSQVTVDGASLTLNGVGLRTMTILGIHGYVAALYVREPSHEAALLLAEPGPKLLEIHFVHAASRARVEAELRRARAMNCHDGCSPGEGVSFNQLLATVRAVRPGDTTGYLLSSDGVEVLFDGKPVTHIADPDFAHRLLAGMIGDHPPQDSVRNGLLGE